MAHTKSILIVGGSGFVGTHLSLRLRQGYHKVFATYRTHPIKIPGVTFLPCDLANNNWVKRIVYMTQPDVLIYAGGNNKVEWSENNERRAELYHSSGPATLTNFAEFVQPKVIFISNPYVFDGTKGNYHENDTVLPVTALGRMKLGGENGVKNKSYNYIILRCSNLFGRGNGLNLSSLDQLRISLDQNQRVEADANTLHSFAPVSGLCEIVPKLIDSGIRNRILHYGGLTKVSFKTFAIEFAKRFKYDPSLIIPKTYMNAKGHIEEGEKNDLSLNSTQLVETLKIKPLLLQEGFDLIDQQLIPRL